MFWWDQATLVGKLLMVTFLKKVINNLRKEFWHDKIIFVDKYDFQKEWENHIYRENIVFIFEKNVLVKF